MDSWICQRIRMEMDSNTEGGSSRCGGSLAAHQTSGAEVPGSNPASSTMILSHANVENLRVKREIKKCTQILLSFFYFSRFARTNVYRTYFEILNYNW